MGQKVSDTTVWDNSHIFASLDDPKIEETFTSGRQRIEALEDLSQKVADEKLSKEERIPYTQELILKGHEIYLDLLTVRTFSSSINSTDAKNEKAKETLSKVSKLMTSYSKVMTPVDVFVDSLDESLYQKFIDHDEVKNWGFRFSHGREFSDFKLNNSEEKIISGLAVDGLHAWGNLYDAITGGMVCDVGGEKVGYAQTKSILRQGDREKREQAFKGINESFVQHEESCAAIVNALNGWRLENNLIRSSKRDLHYLDKACHQSHINRKTLDALMQTTFENRSIGQRGLKAMARAMNIEKLGPWDILAPAPSEKGESKVFGFKESIDLISEAFSRLTPQMGEFAQMMYKKNWIDAKETEFRSPGAYCTKFFKQREPRVFMTFDGSIGNVITLAHELGHAYHNWVMKDLHIVRTFYAMTTAETASIFGETLVRDYLYDNCKTEQDKFEICWQDAESASAMLCNIPARFEFEKNFVEKRKESYVSPAQMKELTNEAWKLWYEDSLSEYDDMFWASKLHFSISQIGFYNYPYLFGYLFSLGIYAEKDNHGDKFNDLYTQILRDTGSMNAIDLIKKHLNKSIEEKEFWQNSLSLVEKSVSRFEDIVG